MRFFLSLILTFIIFLFVAPFYEMMKSKVYNDEKNKLTPGRKNFKQWETSKMLDNPYVVFNSEVCRKKRKAFFNAYPAPAKVYASILFRNFRLLFHVCQISLKKILLFGKHMKQKQQLKVERENLLLYIKVIVFEIWGDSHGYLGDPENYPIVTRRNGRSEVGVDCDIYAITIYGEVPDGVLKNIQDRFKTLVNEPVVKVKVLELPSGKTTRKELVFLVAKREAALHKVNAYFYNNQVKRSDR